MDTVVYTILKDLYLNAEPSVDYDLIDKTQENWYRNYLISAEKELEIIEKHLKGISKSSKQLIKNTVYNLAPKNY